MSTQGAEPPGQVVIGAGASAGQEEQRPARSWLLRANPAAKLLAAAIVALGLLVSIDPVTSGVVLAASLVLLPFARLDRRLLLRMGVPFLLMGTSIGAVNLLFGEEGPMAALGAAVRLMAIALPGMLAALTSDPTDLADSLVQRLRVPERPAIGVLAALRLLPLMAEQWRTLSLARRARGLEAGRNPLAAVRLFAGKAFALLVRVIRTATLLAMAMDSRAFGTGPRTHARSSPWRHRRDSVLLAATVMLVLAAHALSLALGTWDLVVLG